MKPNIHMTSDDLMLAQVRRRLELNGYTGTGGEAPTFPIDVAAFIVTLLTTLTLIAVLITR